MKVRFLLDENLSPNFKISLLNLNPNIDILRVGETNDANLEKPRVWRLLLETKKSSYLFPGLAVNAEEDERPPILVIREDKEGQLMILSPDYTQKKN